MKWFTLIMFTLIIATPAIGGDMNKETKLKYVYFYFMEQKPEAIEQTVPEHIEYWQSLKLKGYTGGPFADGSGGMIIFDANSEESANKTVADDPFLVRKLIRKFWIKPWRAH